MTDKADTVSCMNEMAAKALAMSKGIKLAYPDCVLAHILSIVLYIQ